MNKRKFIFFSIILIFSFNTLFATGKNVKVAYFLIDQYQEGREGERKNGFGYEYLQKISSLTGWNYEYVYGDFTELLDKLAKGEVDIMGDLSYTEERAELINYSAYSTGGENYYIYYLESNEKIIPGKLETYNNKTIGVLRDTYQELLLNEWIKKRNLHLRLRVYTNQDDLIEAIFSGKLDLAAMSTEQAHGSLISIVNLGSSEVYYGVSKQRQDLLDELNSAMNYINQNYPNYNETLVAKYYDVSDMAKKTLSISERKWIENHSVLRIGCLSNNIPFTAIDENGNTTGIINDIIRSLKTNLDFENCSIEVKFYDNNTELKDAFEKRLVDAVFPVLADFNFSETGNYAISDTLVNAILSIVYKGNFTNDIFQRIAVVQESPVWYYAKIYYPNSFIMKCTTKEDCFRALKDDRVDSILLTNYEALNMLNNNSKLKDLNLFTTAPLSFCVLRDNTDILKILNRGLSFMVKEEVNSSLLKYANESYSYGPVEFLRDNVVWVFVFIVILNFALVMAVMSLISYKRNSSAKSNFLFNMSHDIRTPMNAIIGFTNKALQHKKESTIVEDSLVKVKESSDYLLHIINDVLDMSRIEAGKVQLEEHIYSIRDNAIDLISMMSQNALEKGIKIHSNYVNINNNYVYFDSMKLRQILTNIITNAIKYTPEKGQIWFTMEQLNQKNSMYAIFQITIQDNGIGMSKDFQKKIFEQFEREKTTTVSGIQGTGLGMSIVKRLVDMMKGRINVESEPGKGTKVTLNFDFKVPGKEELNRYLEQTKNESVIKYKAESDNKKILLVEDNELNREIAKDILEELGLIVDEAVDGDIAVEKIKHLAETDIDSLYDLIFMDIQMPKMNGYDATKAIRKIPPLNMHIPIIAMTANAFAEDKKMAIQSGMDDHIAKPIDPNRIIEILNKYL